ncbi:MAG: ABC transporter ATP-binding protein [Bradyrhizobium sp.]|jgi:branched-chain amino acid transport system ATP-binding protein
MAAGSEVPLLACKSLTKRFGAMAAVDGLSFEIAAGESLGIGGPNGAGKTTLFDLLSGFVRATSGSIEFAGMDVTHLAPERICQLGMGRTFQLNAAFDSLTVRENVLVGAYFGRRGRMVPSLRVDAGSLRTADEALAMVGISARADAVASMLSVLDRKLLMIATALATGPKLLLMDEPVGGLTPREIDRIVEVICGVKGTGITIVVIEHVMRFLTQLSDRILIMHHGERIYDGSPTELSRDRTVVEVYLGAATAARLAAGPGAAIHG